MAIRTIHTRFFWPSRCDTCKRIPLIHVTYEQRFNVGYEWEDSLSYTYCPICIAKDKVMGFIHRIKKDLNTLILVAPLFFKLAWSRKSIAKSWKTTKLFFR